MTRTRLRTYSVLITLALLCADLGAQCARPDGLDGGPCCSTAQQHVPLVKAFKQEAFNICWRDCDVENLETCTAVWSGVLGPFPTIPTAIFPFGPCAPRLQRLQLEDAAGNVKWSGLLGLTYSRTWSETKSTGDSYQVWRFLVNGDMKPTADAGLSPCPVPPCADDFNGRVRYTGYIDYAKDCSTGKFENAWMLTHACDVIDHAPNFPRAGFFHFNRTYTIVGPSAGFAISPIQPIVSGGTSSEAVRRLSLPAGTALGPITCEYEEIIDAGLEPLQELCVCGFPTAPFQWAISDLGLASSCATSIFTPGGPHLPGYLSMGIGSWTDPSVYPGIEALRWNSGGYDYFDPCVGLTRSEVFFGVTTLGGFAANQITSLGLGFPLSNVFVDQANSLSKKGKNTTMNRPFISNHIINLNFEP